VLEKLTAAGVAVSGLAFPTVDEACVNAVAKWKPARLLKRAKIPAAKLAARGNRPRGEAAAFAKSWRRE
jgi:hypothetical protein